MWKTPSLVSYIVPLSPDIPAGTTKRKYTTASGSFTASFTEVENPSPCRTVMAVSIPWLSWLPPQDNFCELQNPSNYFILLIAVSHVVCSFSLGQYQFPEPCPCSLTNLILISPTSPCTMHVLFIAFNLAPTTFLYSPVCNSRYWWSQQMTITLSI